MQIFKDRREAGEMLGQRLRPFAKRAPVVLALPRGGLPVGAEVARELGAELDILAVKKIGIPGHEELAVGAVSEDGIPFINEELAAKLGVPRRYLERAAEEKAREVEDQSRMFRRHRRPVPLENRFVIVVDDGLATGATMEAAVEILRRRGVSGIVIAVPVSAKDAQERFQGTVEEFISLVVPEEFYAVGLWYKDFSQVSDEEAVASLKGEGKAEKGKEARHVRIPAGSTFLEGDLVVPGDAQAIVLFAHGSGSSHRSPRNRRVAEQIHSLGVATLLFDLLSPEESSQRSNVFDISLLAERLRTAKDWVRERHPQMKIAYFGASTGAAAALQAVAEDPEGIYAVVSRGGRPDLALASLGHVRVPVLLLVGELDSPVIPPTRVAASRLEKGKMVLIPGAGHLFEEPGTLDEVVEYSLNWFRQHLLEGGGDKAEPEIVSEVKALARPLQGDRDLEGLAEAVAAKRIVMMGEATHGTHEFYEVRRRLSQILIEKHGFRLIAVEGDWPDCFALNRYVSGASRKHPRDVMENFRRWPTWMWGNEEVRELVEWMKGKGAGFYGLDVYSLFDSIEVIQKYASRFSLELSVKLLQRYACFDPFLRDEIAYARSLVGFPEGCRKEVVDNLQDLLSLRLDDTRLTEPELFDARQNARVIKNAEDYYRAMIGAGEKSWNVRDQHMLETLDVLLEREGRGAKAIVWAHNTHIGDYRATDMAEEGYVNLGGLAREKYGEENVFLLGFGTYGGKVVAGKAWGAPEEVMTLPDAREGSLENYLHRVALDLGLGEYYLLFDGKHRAGALSRRRGHRAVGVVYSPAYEISGQNYVPTELSRRYDGFVFVDRSSALQSIHPPFAPGLVPETWPTGA